MNEKTIDENTEVEYTFEELAAALDGTPQPASPDSEHESSQTDDSTDKQESSTDPQPEQALPDTVKGLAERLQVDAKTLYQNLKIDLGDGKTVTLGELKDQGKDFARLTAKATQDRLKSETELLQKSMALEEALAKLGRPLNQADYQAVQQKQQLHAQAQTALLAEIVPEFADAVERDKGFKLIGETLKDYAFSDAQIPYITDARLRKMAYDLGKLRQQLDAVASAEVKKPTIKQAPRGSTPPAKSIKQNVRNGRLTAEKAVTELAKYL